MAFFFYFLKVYIMKSQKQFLPPSIPWATLFIGPSILGDFSQTQNLFKIQDF